MSAIVMRRADRVNQVAAVGRRVDPNDYTDSELVVAARETLVIGDA
jgi:hypothetical protein